MTEQINELKLSELHPFPNHPFKVREDEAMANTINSIKEYGVFEPIIVREREAGGYSKKFYEAHEKEILLHREAKNYFNEQNLTKLPDTDSLKKEYAALLSEKNAAYSEYRKQREYRKMLITAKTNVEDFLNLPKTTKKKKDEMVL